ncbi:MAG: M18 family aminopeptidase [Desulfofustis sp.]|nr:M18 family aminopeptidase [Desulfofustis sp.]
MSNQSLPDSLFTFIGSTPTPFHAAANIVRILKIAGFNILNENEKWAIDQEGKYAITRNGSVVAFTTGKGNFTQQGFRIAGAHTDSPSLQLKPHPRSPLSPYFQFSVEKYGGVLLNTWFDRELSLAGRVTVLTEDGSACSCLIDFQKPVLYIPSLAIHLDRKVNEGKEINAQNDICPIFAQNVSSEDQWHCLLLERLNAANSDLAARSVLGYDLFCYDCAPPRYFGLDHEFICGPRLDNLLSCFIALQALLDKEGPSNCMLIFTNHEEIGSTSSSGALSNFSSSVLARICGSVEDQAMAMNRSFFISFDNAHASHPNFSDKGDTDHQVVLNKGPVIKINSSQRYCSNSRSGAMFKLLCAEIGVQTQDFIMRSDMACGSTIGPLTSAVLGVEGVDVGVPTWAMHSIREVTGAMDPELIYLAAHHFFNRDTLPVISNI